LFFDKNITTGTKRLAEGTHPRAMDPWCLGSQPRGGSPCAPGRDPRQQPPGAMVGRRHSMSY